MHPLPDPIIGEDGHYKEFAEVFGTESLSVIENSSSQKRKRMKNSLGFNATQQHVRNVDTVIQCEEGDMWRLLFAKKKFDHKARWI